MELTVNISEDTAYITISGMVDTLESESLLKKLEELPDGPCGIVFDLDKVSYISSAGLRVLLRAMDIASKRGGEMKVAKSSGFVREILEAVGFNKLFCVD